MWFLAEITYLSINSPVECHWATKKKYSYKQERRYFCFANWKLRHKDTKGHFNSIQQFQILLRWWTFQQKNPKCTNIIGQWCSLFNNWIMKYSSSISRVSNQTLLNAFCKITCLYKIQKNKKKFVRLEG